MHSSSFHAHHSPRCLRILHLRSAWGRGGLSIAGTDPSCAMNIGFIRSGVLHQLPFTDHQNASSLDSFAEELDKSEPLPEPVIFDNCQRSYQAGTDTWTEGGLRFTIHTPGVGHARSRN